jgi:hypothetical protein
MGQFDATLAFANAFRCPSCVPDIVVSVDVNGGAGLTVHHASNCVATDDQIAAAATATAQRLSDDMDQAILLMQEAPTGD